MVKSRNWRVGIIGDTHIPAHCPKKIALSMAIMKDAQVDEIVINGDLVDFYKISRFPEKDPEVKESLADEIDQTIGFLKILRRDFPDQKIHYILGNHCDRVRQYIINKAPALWNFFKLEEMLRLEELNITWQPYNTSYELNKKLRVQHSPPSYSVAGPRQALLKKPDCSWIWNCTHRVGHTALTGANGDVYHAWYNGHLLDDTNPVFKYAKNHQNWQASMMIVDVINDTEFHAHQIHLNGNKATWGNNHYDFS